MNKIIEKKTPAFTLLEIIIVIIIIGVLASLALPRLFTMIETSRKAEALVAITSIRSALERCYLMNNGSYENCGATFSDAHWGNLGMDNPSTSPNAHFRYYIQLDGKMPFIVAQRTSNEWGFDSDHLSNYIIYDYGSNVIAGSDTGLCGTCIYANLGEQECFAQACN